MTLSRLGVAAILASVIWIFLSSAAVVPKIKSNALASVSSHGKLLKRSCCCGCCQCCCCKPCCCCCCKPCCCCCCKPCCCCCCKPCCCCCCPCCGKPCCVGCSGYGRRRRLCANDCVPTIISGAGTNSYSNSALPPAPFPLALLPKMLSPVTMSECNCTSCEKGGCFSSPNNFKACGSSLPSGSGSLPPDSPTPVNLATAPASESDTLSSDVSHDPTGSVPSGAGSQKTSDSESSGCHCCDCGCCDCGCCGCCGGWGCKGRMNLPHPNPNSGSVTSSGANMDTASPLAHQNDAAPVAHVNQPSTSTDTVTAAKTKVVRRMAYHRLNSKPLSKHHHHSTRHNHTKHRKPPRIVHKVVIKDSHCKCH